MQPRRRRIPPEVALNTQLFIPTLAVCLATGILLERLTWSKPDRTPATEAPRRERATKPTPHRCVPAEAADDEIGPLREEMAVIEDEYEAMFGPEPSFVVTDATGDQMRRLLYLLEANDHAIASMR